MESLQEADLRRSSSTTSASSSRKSSTVRVRPRKHSSNTSLKPAPTPSDKSLTSFPSLSPSPESSPVSARGDAFRPPPTPPLHPSNDAASATVRKVSKAAQSLVGTLIASTPSSQDRTALFDDVPQDTRAVPGNIHHASDEHLEKMLERQGAINLVRQLASDLAERDAQMTALRRRTEERERILRKMLQECEVSNLDIETRLRDLDKTKPRQNGDLTTPSRTLKRKDDLALDGTHPEDGLGSRLARAIEDEHTQYGDALSVQEEISIPTDYPTPELGSASPSKSGEGTRNWKSYIWNGTNKRSSNAPSIASNLSDEATNSRSRASSGTYPPRKGLSNDLFLPPHQGSDKPSPGLASLRRLQSEDRAASASSTRKTSTSVTSWALRLVAGSNNAKGDPDKHSLPRGRPSAARININEGRDHSASSVKTTRSAGAGGPPVARGRPLRNSLGPTGTIKSVSPESVRAAQSKLGPSSPHGPPPGRNASNLGPVEMDTILPDDARPPTLMPYRNLSSSQEFLTDRFGFIYDQRRRKRQSEAAAAIRKQKRSSNVESLGDARDAIPDFQEVEEPSTSPDTQSLRPASAHSSSEEQPTQQPGKRWQDFLKLATFPTELLSHTPSAAPITAVETVEADVSTKSSTVSVDKRGSIPALSAMPDPAPSRVSALNAEFVSPSGSVPSSPTAPLHKQPDPVKALLEQLTELHDNLQREKTVRWNEFLRKVRAERKREGEAAAADGKSQNLAMPETLLADGEIIGIASLGNKGNVGRAKWKEFRQLVLGGIPVTYRAKVWAECSGAAALRVPGYYEDIVNNGEDDPAIAAQIQMDITRTLTDNIFFRKGPGVQKLNEVLLAYSRRNVEVGYCQGMNLIAACLLLIMPSAEDAFWVLASMIENILPQNYYDHSLLTSRADQVVLRQYVSELLPKLSAHLDNLSIELEALTFQWFLSVFTDCLSAEALFRVWDVVLCMHDGSTFLFQVALALLKLNERALLDCDNPAAVYHYINHQMTNHAISIDGLIQASEALRKVVRRADVEERRIVAVEREREIMKQREELRRERARNVKERAEAEAAAKKDAADASDATGGVEVGSGASGSLGSGNSSTNGMEPETALVGSSPPQTMSRSSSVARSSMFSREDEGDVDGVGVDVDGRAKMGLPIDEEVMWRA